MKPIWKNIKWPINMMLAFVVVFLNGCNFVWEEDEKLKGYLKKYFTEAVINGRSIMVIDEVYGRKVTMICYQNEYIPDSRIEKSLSSKIIFSPKLSSINYAIWVKYKDGGTAYALFIDADPLIFKGFKLCTKDDDPRVFIQRNGVLSYFSFHGD